MTPVLGLIEIAEGVASQSALHNQALREFEARTSRVLSRALTTPPGSPAESDAYIIPAAATGVWSGKTNQIATYIGGAWSYYVPIEGCSSPWVNNEDKLVTFDGANWVISGGASGGTVTSVAQTVPAFLSVGGSPVTTTGTLAITLSGAALPVANGGTGATSLTAYAPVFGGTTSTNPVQSGTAGTSGQVLTSNGAGVLPTFQAAGGSVTLNNIGTATADATLTGYTPGTGTGGFIALTPGTGAGSSGVGGALTVKGGTGSATGAAAHGGAVSVTGGTPGATSGSQGGAITVTGGVATGTGISGAVTIKSGADTAGGGVGALTVQGGIGAVGGAVFVTGGSAAVGSGTGLGGDVTVASGASDSTTGSRAGNLTLKVNNSFGNTAGVLAVTGGNSGTVSFGNGNAGGAVTITAGVGGNPTSGWTNGTGGAVSVTGGTCGGASGGTGGAGGAVTMQGGAASAFAGSVGGAANVLAANGTSTGTGAAGASVAITAGNAGGSAANAGGDITLTTGTATSTGVPGNIITKSGVCDQAYSKQVPTTGFSITIAAATQTLILDPAGTLATGTITMPAKPADGQQIRITCTQIITALTVSANAGQSITNAPTAFNPNLTGSQGYEYMYVIANTTWYRLQ